MLLFSPFLRFYREWWTDINRTQKFQWLYGYHLLFMQLISGAARRGGTRWWEITPPEQFPCSNTLLGCLGIPMQEVEGNRLLGIIITWCRSPTNQTTSWCPTRFLIISKTVAWTSTSTTSSACDTTLTYSRTVLSTHSRSQGPWAIVRKASKSSTKYRKILVAVLRIQGARAIWGHAANLRGERAQRQGAMSSCLYTK